MAHPHPDYLAGFDTDAKARYYMKLYDMRAMGNLPGTVSMARCAADFRLRALKPSSRTGDLNKAW